MKEAPPRLGEIIGSFAGRNILLLGDVICDIYHRGCVVGVSAETPTLVAREESTAVSLGGAGLVMRNILALGGKVTLCTLVGADASARLVRAFRNPHLRLAAFAERGRTTTVKERFWADGYKLLSWDHLDNRPIAAALEKKIHGFVRTHLAAFDVLAVSDYRHGCVTERLARQLVALAHRAHKPIIVDSQISQARGNHVWYRGADTVCLNQREAVSVDPTFSSRAQRASLFRVQKILKAKNVVVKLGERGSASVVGKTYFASGPRRVEAVDTTGAGDAFFSVLALGGAPSSALLSVANAWAALSTTIIGTEPPTKEALADALSNR